MWFKLLLFLFIVYAVNAIIKFALKKWLKVEPRKKKFFSKNYVNETHLKVDWFVRGILLIAGVATLFYVIAEENSIVYMLVYLIVFIILTYAVEAYFEWKASKHPKQSLFMLSEMFVWLVAVALLIQSSSFFLGIIEGIVTEKAEASFTVEMVSTGFWGDSSVEEVHLTDATVFKGKVEVYEELKKGDLVRVMPFDLPADFSYSLAAEVTVE